MFIDRSVTPHVVYAPFPYYEKNASRCELIWQLPTLPQDDEDDGRPSQTNLSLFGGYVREYALFDSIPQSTINTPTCMSPWLPRVLRRLGFRRPSPYHPTRGGPRGGQRGQHPGRV